ncbi:hypothetical protein VTK26DRAFT_6671 [Humicola hyalothermophila]
MPCQDPAYRRSIPAALLVSSRNDNGWFIHRSTSCVAAEIWNLCLCSIRHQSEGLEVPGCGYETGNTADQKPRGMTQCSQPRPSLCFRLVSAQQPAIPAFHKGLPALLLAKEITRIPCGHTQVFNARKAHSCGLLLLICLNH